MTTMNAIQWPKKWIPGETDNFVSNEVIVKGLDFNKVVQHLRDASYWEKYYKNSGNIHMHNQDNTILTRMLVFVSKSHRKGLGKHGKNFKTKFR
ncbi:hypothetical protein VN0229_14890 [Helicobacter pylori]|nr:hypothetical protein VN0229_14890 [Helicobacter pylori]